jgi:hypothetical protein
VDTLRRCPRAKIRERELIGWAEMIGLAFLFGWLAIRDERHRRP